MKQFKYGGLDFKIDIYNLLITKKNPYMNIICKWMH